MGKGHSSRSVSPVMHRHKPGQVSSLAVPVSNVSRHGPQEPDFEGFSGSAVGFSLSTVLQIKDTLSYDRQSVVLWRSLLGRLSSLCHPVPGDRLRMRSLQLVLRASWDFLDEPVSVAWTPSVQQDLQWWSDEHNLLAGMPLEPLTPDLLFLSDASDQGWGAHLTDQFFSGLWSSRERQLSINLWELWIIRLSLYHFRSRLLGMMIGVYLDSTTALAYLRRQGGTFSLALNEEAQLLLCCAESLQISLVPQFIMGTRNFVADSLSRRQQVLGSEWTVLRMW